MVLKESTLNCTRCAPPSYKWSDNQYNKWSYTWVTGVIISYLQGLQFHSQLVGADVVVSQDMIASALLVWSEGFDNSKTSHLKDGKTLAKMVLERAYCCNYGVSAAFFLAVWKEGVLCKWKLWATLLQDQLF